MQQFLSAFPIAIIDEDYEGRHAAGRGMQQLAAAIEREGFRVVAGVSYADARRLVNVFNSESCWLVSVDGAEATAEQWAILEEVLGCFGDADQVSFRDFISTLVQTHTVHAYRRWEEMGLVAKTLRETGVAPLMTEATESSLRRTVDARIAPPDGKVPSLADALAMLSEKVVRGR